MGLENSYTQGSKGNNSQWQKAVLNLLQQIVAASGGGGGGSATAGNQVTGNNTLSAINGKLPSVLGQNVLANSLSVVLASDQTPIDVNFNKVADLSTLNSSTTLLGANAVFTGNSEDITQYAESRISIYSDVIGSLNIQTSPNNVNWSNNIYSIPAATVKEYGIGAGARYFRVVYTNGVTIQTVFSVQTIHKKLRTKPSSVAPQDGRTNDNDMEEDISYQMLFNGTTWDRSLKGQQTMTNSQAITIASNQTPLNIVPTSSATAAAAGIKGTFTAYGYQRMTLEPKLVFSDPFDGVVVDVTNNWTQSGTVTQTGGLASIGNITTTTTVNNLVSKPTFPPSGLNFLVNAFVASFEANPLSTTNVNRFVGFGVHTGTPSTSVPITDGVGFEWDSTTSKLYAAVWQNSVRSASSVDLTASVTSASTRYAVVFRSDLAIFYINSTEIPVAVISFVTPNTQILPVRAQTVIGGSTPSATPNMQIGAIVVGDTGGNASQIADGTFPWRKVQVSSTGALLMSSPGLPITLGQQAAATSQPVALANEDVQDLYFTGQAAQTATVNNIIPTVVSANGTDLTGYRSGSIQIFCPAGTYTTGQIIFEGTNDSASGTIWQTIPVWNQIILTGTPITAAITLVTTTSIVYTFPVTTRYVRVRISTAVSGASASVQAFSKFSQTTWVNPVSQIAQATAANLNTTATIASGTVTTVSTLSNTTQLTPGVAATNLGKAEDAAASSGDVGVFVLGVRRDAPVVSASATGDYQEMAVNKWGAILVANYEKTAKTFSATGNVSAAASATDIAILPGNATNTAYVTKVIVSGIQTTAGAALVQLIKRSTANSGGTSGAMTAVPHDSADAAAVSAPLAYTANPTPGTAVGTIRAAYMSVGSATAPDAPIVFDFGDKGKQIVLSGVAQGLAINLNGVTLTGGTISVTYEWVEI